MEEEEGMHELKRVTWKVPEESEGIETGLILVLPGVETRLEAAGRDVSEYIMRHTLGDFGDLSDAERAQNAEARQAGETVTSVYDIPEIEGRLLIQTCADRSETLVFLEED